MFKITYLIALYNKSKYIREAIDSILSDSSSDYELEVCVVDDGSYDNSLEIVRATYGGDNRVKIDFFLKNKGKVAAYNRAYAMSDGDFVAIFGADDTVLPGRTAKLFRSCVDSGKASYGGYIKHIQDIGDVCDVYPKKIVNFHENILENRLTGGCGMLHRSEADLIFPMPEDLKFEDWWISFHLTRLNKVVTIQDLVLRYRIHGGNDSGVQQVSYESTCIDYERHIKYLDSFLPFLTSAKDFSYLIRAKDIRFAFLNRRVGLPLLRGPFNKSWVHLFILNLCGPRFLIYLVRYKISFKKYAFRLFERFV